MSFKNYCILIFFFLVISFATNGESNQIDIQLTPSAILTSINNEKHESETLKTYKDSINNILKVTHQKNCNKQCAETLVKTSINELLLVDQEVRDPYYGKIDTGFTDCVENIEIEKMANNFKLNQITNVNLYSNKKYSLGRCKKPDSIHKLDLTFLYCEKEQKLFTIKYFYPLTGKNKINYRCLI